MFIKIFFSILTSILLAASNLYAQKVFIEKDNNKILLKPTSWIGLTSKNDTVKYIAYKELSFTIYQTTHDSLIIRRPLNYYDTAVLYYAGVYEKLGFDYQVGKFFKRDKEQYVLLRKIVSYQYKQFAYADITTITYPTHLINEQGCVGCFFIPGVNVWYLLHAANKTKAKIRDMSKWKFVIE